MADCKNLIHPFQNDTGTSQSQRLMPALDANGPKIDGRTLSDLLDYFTKLSRHINYYDSQMGTGDWQPFFSNSVPFILASISKYNTTILKDKFDFYQSLFNKRPNKNSLQLLVYFIYYNTIFRINSWHLVVKGSGLPFEGILQNLVRDRLQEVVRNFIHLANAASREHCIRSIDFTPLLKNDIWNLTAGDLLQVDRTTRARRGTRNRMVGLMQALAVIWPTLTEAIALLGSVAEESIEESLFKQKDDLKQKHAPHLALLFAFLKLFQHLQSDLNSFTRKHLDFFFKDVLRLVPRPAIADKTHLVFEIQKQLQNYLVKKGIVVKDAKDKNNQEILFSLDDEIVVNKTTVADLRTLYLDPNVGNDNPGDKLIEGIYIAPKADKADGIKKDFKDADPKNWSTLGAHYSKFIDVGKTAADAYPYARIGFILASPVLLLSEGRRTVTISLLCELNDNCSNPDPLIKDAVFFNALQNFFKKTFVIVSKDLILQAQAKGISEDTLAKLAGLLHVKRAMDCCPPTDEELQNPKELTKLLADKEDSIQLTKNQWLSFLNNATPLDPTDDIDPNEQIILNTIFKEHRPFTVLFSGKDAWIEPSSILKMRIKKISVTNYKIIIKARLNADKPGVTYYDKDKLKEDFNTKLPLVKIEMDQALHIEIPAGDLPTLEDCCFKACKKDGDLKISPYTFLRNLSIIDFIPATPIVERTIIHVKVCGLKTFIVQNDENVGDVNAIILPFGSRPKQAANFYIGSKEVLCKNWMKMVLRFFWKDLPPALEVYYHGYEDIFTGIDTNYFLNDKFQYSAEMRDRGTWSPRTIFKKKLFTSDTGRICSPLLTGEQQFFFNRNDFTNLSYLAHQLTDFTTEIFTNTSQNGFLKISLRDRDFQHSRYSFVLARQMMALGKFPNEIYLGPVYDGFPALPTPLPASIKTLSLQELFTAIQDAFRFSANLDPRITDIVQVIRAGFDANFGVVPFPLNINAPTDTNALGNPPSNAALPLPPYDVPPPAPPNPFPTLANFRADFIMQVLHTKILDPVKQKIDDLVNKLVVIPNEPYTPQIKGISIDYTAVAKFEDITFLHLYPYEQTYKEEEIELKPSLLPTHCDEGTLFIGLKDLVPGSNLNILFQFAEATADSESDRADVLWHYLANNQWKPLRNGFEVLNDATNQLTTSGIIKFSIPGNISDDNTVMPKQLFWIKASAVHHVEAVSETIGIHAQAMLATFINTTAHDQLRLDAPLEAKKLSKLQEPDASVKKVDQPYETFGGRIPETEGYYYIRISEWLRHKGRGIQKFDYERLVLDAFPEVFKVKCINHEFGLNAHLYRLDVNAAPGYVVIAVIPDLNKLKSGQSFEPKVPVSLLEKITDYLKKRISPFARIRVMNPRYEKLDLCITVQLIKGKDKVYYKSRLEYDLRLFLAPWAVGSFDRLDFGQCVNRSDIVRFIESRDYVDYIICLEMKFEQDCESGMVSEVNEVCPLTPRSIIVGGNIDICIPSKDKCEEWKDEADNCSKTFPVTAVKCLPANGPIG